MTAYLFTRYAVTGNYESVLEALETKIETITNTKTIHLVKILPKGNEFVGVLLYIT